MSHTICQNGTFGTKSSWMLVHLVEENLHARGLLQICERIQNGGFTSCCSSCLGCCCKPLGSRLHQNDWKPAGLLPPMHCNSNALHCNALQIQCTALQSRLSVPLPKPWAHTACFKANAKSMSLQSSMQYPDSRNHAKSIVALDNNWTYCTVCWKVYMAKRALSCWS